MDLLLYNITNHKNAQTNITKNYQWGERNTDLAPNKRTNQNTVTQYKQSGDGIRTYPCTN